MNPNSNFNKHFRNLYDKDMKDLGFSNILDDEEVLTNLLAEVEKIIKLSEKTFPNKSSRPILVFRVWYRLVSHPHNNSPVNGNYKSYKITANYMRLDQNKSYIVRNVFLYEETNETYE